MTVGQIDAIMSSRELVEWKVYFDLLEERDRKDSLASEAQRKLEQRKRNRTGKHRMRRG